MIRIGSRGSELALWQARSVRAALLAADPGLRVEIEVIRTTGDRVQDVPLAKIGDRGLFTKEIDAALLDGRADLAVHSLKDVPTELGDGLRLGAVTRREDPRDCLVLERGRAGGLADLPAGARIGTSSLRRRAQLRATRPDLEVLDLRGNLNTRLDRLDGGAFEGILLATAGLLRLGWGERISERLPLESWLPAVGQGALAVVIREGDSELLTRLAPLEDPVTAAETRAERTFLNRLEGGCQIPIGAIGRAEGDTLSLDGFVADLDGRTLLRDRVTGPAETAERLGRELADRLLERGAGEILERIRREAGDAPPIPAP